MGWESGRLRWDGHDCERPMDEPFNGVRTRGELNLHVDIDPVGQEFPYRYKFCSRISCGRVRNIELYAIACIRIDVSIEYCEVHTACSSEGEEERQGRRSYRMQRRRSGCDLAVSSALDCSAVLCTLRAEKRLGTGVQAEGNRFFLEF